jgi:beta-galactosidase/beta-glucuronidase
MVSAHKNHPAILMWAVGNDLNADSMYGASKDNLFSLNTALFAYMRIKKSCRLPYG